MFGSLVEQWALGSGTGAYWLTFLLRISNGVIESVTSQCM